MLEKHFIKEHLAKTLCHKCGASLETAKLTTISEVPVALVAHAKCVNCQAESMITITLAGSGIMPVISDLTGQEIKKFIGAKSISYDELLDLHKMLQKNSICKLMQKKEQNSEKKQKK